MLWTVIPDKGKPEGFYDSGKESSQRGPSCFSSVFPYCYSLNLFLIIFQSFSTCHSTRQPSLFCRPLLHQVSGTDFCQGFSLTFMQKLKIIIVLDKDEQNASRMIYKKRSSPACPLLTALTPSCGSMLNWHGIVCKVSFNWLTPLSFKLCTFLQRRFTSTAG